jgi:hypothetical protein
MGDPIRIEPNPKWVDPKTRPACKYSPVIVDKRQGDGAIESMVEVLQRRVELCRKLGVKEGDKVAWFSFRRLGPTHEPHLRQTSVPVIVISGGSGKKLAYELGKDYSLAWHPMNVRNDPVYLLVHVLDFQTYAQALAGIMGRFRNLHLIGWDGAGLTGFGAARVAALTFADQLPYRPQRILLMDQDVVKTEATRFDQTGMAAKVEKLHATGKPIIGYGVGYPERAQVQKLGAQFGYPGKASAAATTAPAPRAPSVKPAPSSSQKVTAPVPVPNKPDQDKKEFDSPTQQFVSIKAPFRKLRGDGIYPAFMVAGGEDMLMSLQLGLMDSEENSSLLNEKIVKKELGATAAPTLKPTLQDTPNAYWNVKRVETLKALYDEEKTTPVWFEGQKMTLEALMAKFQGSRWMGNAEAEVWNVSACVIERIILRLYKLQKFPSGFDTTGEARRRGCA